MAAPAPRLAVSLALAPVLLLAPAAGASTWTDATSAAGIAFRTAGEIGPHPWPGFPEIMGGGSCWADFDGDGYDDAYLVNQRYNWHNPAYGPWAEAADPVNHLYLSGGDGTFREVGAWAGVDSRAFGYGCSAADYDGDGCVDLFVANFGPSELYRSLCDGRFENVTAALGAVLEPGYCGPRPCMSQTSSWADYDLDGDLDLYVGNYVNTHLEDTSRGPFGHTAQKNFLLRNDGDGTFTDVAEDAGVAGNPTDEFGSKTLGVVWLDHDRDGDMDLYVANDETPNNFYVNHGDGTFHDGADDAGVADPRASMGLTAGDYDNDGYPDLFFTHHAHEQNGFYRNKGDGSFEDRSGEDAMEKPISTGSGEVGWGTHFIDVDRDRDLDIVLVNGHTDPLAADYSQVGQLFRQDAPLPGAPRHDAVWVNATPASGALADPRVGKGLAAADFDLDGDTDLLLVNNGNQTADLLVASGAAGGWLNVRLAQPGMNRAGIGAKVEVIAGGESQHREVQAGSSFLSQNSLTLEFGLGDALTADVTVRWPGGGTTQVAGLARNQTVRIDRALGGAVLDVLAPRTTPHPAGDAGEGGWWLGPVDVTLAPADLGAPTASGVASTEFRVGSGAWQPYAGGPIGFAGDGVHELRFRSADHAGNREPPRILEVGIDATPPTVGHALSGTPGLGGWWVSDSVRVTLAAEDATSGVGSVRYRVGGGPWVPYTGPFDLTEDGTHTVQYAARDRAGHMAAPGEVVVKLDHTAPALVLTKPAAGVLYLGDERAGALLAGPAAVIAMPEVAGVGGATFTATADASDAASGVARVDFRLNGEVVRADAQAPYAWVWDTRGSPSGLFEVRAVATDAAGNAAAAALPVVLLSGTPEGIAATLQEGPSLHLPDPLAAYAPPRAWAGLALS